MHGETPAEAQRRRGERKCMGRLPLRRRGAEEKGNAWEDSR